VGIIKVNNNNGAALTNWSKYSSAMTANGEGLGNKWSKIIKK